LERATETAKILKRAQPVEQNIVIDESVKILHVGARYMSVDFSRLSLAL
jgi:hypothetical protein